ncbi:hypothetical protein EW146_g4478 [Bondarzewia mesenterica]|uniref:Uncharacterized protein n=1 Tax=Bondarzewia mesenterica TaxID=1095465 RepID=A0A4S4LUL4_9AGAM|nr:hypothetical protein EW146_g4478 [Bondarzewia mesenterica]
MPSLVLSSVEGRPASSPDVLLNVLSNCHRSGRWGDVEQIFHAYWPSRAYSLCTYARLNVDWLTRDGAWRPAPVVPLSDIQFERVGLNSKFAIAKRLVSELLPYPRYTLDRLLRLRLSPIFILYATLDLDRPLPSDYDMQFMWRHLSRLLRLGRAQDLVCAHSMADADDGDTRPENCAPHSVDDPDGVLEILWHQLYPGVPRKGRYLKSPKQDVAAGPARGSGYASPSGLSSISSPSPASVVDVYVGMAQSGTGGVAITSAYTDSRWTKGEKSFSVPHPAARVTELHALLDTVCCWADEWTDHVVRFHVCSVPTAWHLNGFADYAPEFPALELLRRAARRWGFEMEACFVGGSCETPSANSHTRRAANLARASFQGQTLAKHLPLNSLVMDSVLMDLHEIDEGLREGALPLYERILKERDVGGYRSIVLQPGTHYQKVRCRAWHAEMQERRDRRATAIAGFKDVPGPQSGEREYVPAEKIEVRRIMGRRPAQKRGRGMDGTADDPKSGSLKVHVEGQRAPRDSDDGGVDARPAKRLRASDTEGRQQRQAGGSGCTVM